MAGFAMILGGAMSGWSDARLDEIKAERDARMKELEEQRQDRRIADERSFRSQEAEIGRQHDTSMQDKREKFEAGQNDLSRAATRENREDTQSFQSGENKTERDYRSGESQADRDFRSQEAEKGREASGDVVTGEDGTSYSRVGSRASRITDEEGKPIKLAGSAKGEDKPAEVSTAEWLIQQGVAPDAASAWKMVRSARSDPEKSRASIYKAWVTALTAGRSVRPAQMGDIEKAAREATEKTLEYLNSEEPGASKPGAEDTGQASSTLPPTDPAKRTIGKIYTNKQGQKARWKGNGWELVQ